MRWLLLFGALLALLAWVLSAALAPLDHGIARAVFRNPGKAAEPIDHVVVSWERRAVHGR